MLLDFDSKHYTQSDCDIIKDNINEIIELGLNKYKKKHNATMTASETLLLNIFIEYGYKCLTKQFVADEYNHRMYKTDTQKYVAVNAITTKVNRLNRKLKGMRIVNKYGYGYSLLII